MSSQHYVDKANEEIDKSGWSNGSDGTSDWHLGQAQVNATLAVAASIHDLISHLRGVTPARPFGGDEPGGCWVAYSYDVGPYVISAHATETEALRIATGHSGHAVFLPWGADLNDTVKAST